jgi:glycosyltransferase involved in cell wall biosynthesis
MSVRAPVISVIMPSYNHAKFISSAIESVLSQSTTDLELIIVDDNSLDQSRRTIRGWAMRDKRIRTVFHPSNQGISRTVNDGLDRARGKFVSMIASDDMFKEGALENTLNVLESSRGRAFGAVVFNSEWIDDRNKKLTTFSTMYGPPSKNEGNFFREQVFRGGIIGVGLIRRSVLEKHSLRFDERVRYYNDNLFWLDLSRVCDFIYLDEPLYLHRLHPTNTFTVRNKEKMLRDSVLATRVTLEKYSRLLDNEMRSALEMSLGRANAGLGRFSEASECFRLSAALAGNPLRKIRAYLFAVAVSAAINREFLYCLAGLYGNAIAQLTVHGRRHRPIQRAFGRL